eukprot:GFUD01011510.1.p1 GENE.GFUD01011510.1~~GFUD01011510.1.p1  ORF type:complete len:358 (+),score=149.87 GFUD01011510.1:615-1688(+)
MLDSFKESCLRYCYWVGDTLKRLLVIVSVSAFSISLAVTLYGGLYWAILPSSATSITVKWDFTSCQVVGQPCSFIRSEVGLARKQMAQGSRYNVELLLDVPDSPANREVGMFLVCITLLPINITTCSSAMVPFRSLLVTSLESVILLPLHIARLASSTNVLSIPLLENHTESITTLSSTTSLQLELQTSKLQVSSSRLKIWPCDLSGVRYLMYHHPLLSTLLGVTTILTVTCLTAALAIAKFLQPHRVVAAPRTKSNHDLADRQARARLNQEYRQARLREIRDEEEVVADDGHSTEAESITRQETVPSTLTTHSAVTDSSTAGCDSYPGIPVSSLVSSSSVTVQRLDTGLADHQKLE